MLDIWQCPKCGKTNSKNIFDSKGRAEMECLACGCEWRADIKVSIRSLGK